MIAVNLYRLPVPKLKLKRIDRTSSPAHTGKLTNAIDFIVPENTPVLAAAEGIVTYVKDDSNFGGSNVLYWNHTNFIVIMHRNGEYSRYDHLAYRSSKVIVGQHVGACQEIGLCRLVVATRRDYDWSGSVQRGGRIRVATKYVRTAREHFAAKGMHVDLIKLYGSMELGPLVGLSDAIVDLVSTGGTLRANNLVEVEEIVQISSRLVVNQAALKLKRERLTPILEAFERASAALA